MKKNFVKNILKHFRETTGRYSVAFQTGYSCFSWFSKNDIKKIRLLRKNIFIHAKNLQSIYLIYERIFFIGTRKLVSNTHHELVETKQYYIPYYSVLNESSLTTKLKVAYDVSASTATCFFERHTNDRSRNTRQFNLHFIEV